MQPRLKLNGPSTNPKYDKKITTQPVNAVI